MAEATAIRLAAMATFAQEVLVLETAFKGIGKVKKAIEAIEAHEALVAHEVKAFWSELGAAYFNLMMRLSSEEGMATRAFFTVMVAKSMEAYTGIEDHFFGEVAFIEAIGGGSGDTIGLKCSSPLIDHRIVYRT